MMKHKRGFLVYLIQFSLLLALMSSYRASSANWVQGEARIQIGRAPLTEVRAQGIKQAIADATYRAGGVITSEQLVLNGLLIGSEIAFETQGIARRVNVLSETIDDDILQVIVEVDVGTGEICQRSPYQHKVLVGQFELLTPWDSRVGNIAQLGPHISKRLAQQLEAQPQFTTELLPNAIVKVTDRFNVDVDAVAARGRYLAQAEGFQFVVFGYIRDISLFNAKTDGFFVDDVKLKRNYTMRVLLLDGLNGALIMDESYHVEANWDFNPAQTIGLTSALFWQSDYGRAVLGNVANAVVDVVDTVGCQTQYAQIVARLEDSVVINLGSRDGVKMGDTFNLHKASQIHGQFKRKTYQFFSRDEDQVFEVVGLNQTTAKLSSISPDPRLGAELFDWVTPQLPPLKSLMMDEY